MIDYHSTLVKTLSNILPTHYELFLHSGLDTPCISYMETNNADDVTGDTIGYSKIKYQIKVWGNDLAVIQNYAKKIDKALRTVGFKRISAGELHDNQSTMIQKIMTYECLALEKYEGEI
jgi:hypothetical protein